MQCKSTCESTNGHMEKICCWVNCTLAVDKLLDANNLIDTTAMIAYLNEKMNKKEAWVEPIKKTVLECVKECKLFLFLI